MNESQHDRFRRVRCETLDDCVREGFTVEILCKSCGRVRRVPAKPMLARALLKMWTSRTLIAVSMRLKCSCCKKKQCSVSASAQPSDNLPPIGPANEQEFQRLKRSLRG